MTLAVVLIILAAFTLIVLYGFCRWRETSADIDRVIAGIDAARETNPTK